MAFTLQDEEDQGFSLADSTPNYNPRVSRDVAQKRALKIQYILGEDMRDDPEFVADRIEKGEEDEVRAEVANIVARRERDKKTQMLQEAISLRDPSQPLSQEDADLLNQLASYEQVNEKSVIEDQFAKKYTQDFVTTGESPIVEDALNEAPEEANAILDLAEDTISNFEFTNKLIEEYQEKWKDMGFFSKTGDFLETIIPFKSALNTHDAVSGANTESYLQGSNIRDQLIYLWSLPSHRFQIELELAVSEIAETNVSDAIMFLNAVKHYGSNDEFLDNLFTVVDIVDVGTLGATAGLKGLKALRRSVKQGVKSVADKNVTVETLQAAAGDLKSSSATKAVKLADEAMSPLKDSDVKAARVGDKMPAFTNPENFRQNPGSLGVEGATRILDNLHHVQDKMIDALELGVRGTRLGQLALREAVLETQESILKQYTTMQDAVLEVVEETNPLTNTNSLAVRFGRPDATGFDTGTEAFITARDVYKLPEGTYQIDQVGNAFTITVKRDIDETTKGVRDVLIETENKTPVNFVNTFLGALRTPEETLSTLSRTNRHTAVHGVQELVKVASDASKDIGKLSKKSVKDLRTILEGNRDFISPDGQRGKFHATVGELEKDFLKRIGRVPTEKEAQAYFTAVQLNDLDWLIRNNGIYRDKSRLGVRQMEFSIRRFDQEEGRWVFSDVPEFEGRFRDDIPWDDDLDAGIWIEDDLKGRGQFVDKNSTFSNKRAEIQKLIDDKKYKVVQVYDPNSRPLKDVAGVKRPVNFILVRNITERPLKFDQLPYRPGGHVEYASTTFVKQPVIKNSGDKNFYQGDVSWLAVESSAEGANWAKKMNSARKLLKDGDIKGFNRFVEENLPYTPWKLRQMFDGDDAKFSLDHDFVVTRSGQNTNEAANLKNTVPSFVDSVDSPYNLSGQVNKRFTQERDMDIPTIREDVGTESSPVYKLDRPRLVDPLASTQRALNSVMRDRYMGDYKTQAIENFVQEFNDILEVPLSELRENPLKLLYDDPKFVKGADEAKVAAALNSRNALLNLLGTPTKTAENINWVKGKLLDSIYDNLGTNASRTIAEHLLPTTKDPTVYLRGMAFHSKLGLFNPVQLFLQAQGLFVTSAISPRHAMKSMPGAFLGRRALHCTDEVLDSISQKSKTFGWKPEEFKEATLAYRRSGYANVGGEVAWRDDTFDPELIRGRFGQVLDAGTIFFREGERSVRSNAFYTSYLEWRAKNPGRKLTNRAEQDILRRADDLALSMTNASSAQWQRGVLSIPTQFLSYNVRMMELFTGKRLTAGEKARMFTMLSATYGVPTAIGGVTGLPIYEVVRKHLLESGVDVDESNLEPLVEGMFSSLIEAATGEDFAVAERLGPGGLNILNEIARGDKTIIDLFMGASGSILGDILRSSQPAVMGIMDTFSDSNEAYPLRWDDLETVTRNISTVNNAYKAWYAANLGKYLTRNGVPVGEVSVTGGLVSAILGPNPQNLSDTFIKFQSLKDLKNAQKEPRKQAISNFRKGLTSESQEDRLEYFRRAKVWLTLGDFRPDQKGQIFREATKGFKDLDKIADQQFIKKAPASEINDRQKGLQ